MPNKKRKLTEESKDKIRKAMLRRSEQRANLELSVEGRRVYIRAMTNSAVSLKVDITPVWHFFKETLAFKAHKEKGLPEEEFKFE